MKAKEYRKYGIIAVVIGIILIICAVKFFSLNKEFLAASCCGIAFFVFFYALLAFIVKDDKKNLTKEEKKEKEQEDNLGIFDPNNYPR